MPVVRSEKRIVSTRTEIGRPVRLKRTLNIKEFCEKRNKILIVRGVGGLGDILMHRMIFEDFKITMPDAEVYFACPQQYHDAVKDHPFVNKILGTENIDRESYMVSYNTSTACGRYEMKIAPLSDLHRSDIWANHCGLSLTRHDMHFRLTEEEIKTGKELIESKRDRDGPIVILSPVSAMANKNLWDQQLLGVVAGLHKRNCCVVALHSTPLYPLVKNDVPFFSKLNLRHWLAVIHEADYVVSVDTATFHCAGGMRKPVVGIYTFVNGKTYSKYYPTAEIVQGPCPFGHTGCYNWTICPKTDKLKPCLLGLTAESVLSGVDKMLEKYP